MQTIALFALLMPTVTAMETPVPSLTVQQDPPLQVWLSRQDNLDFGDRVRVYVRAEEDGHLVVFHADPEGRIRVLFPIDPYEDDFIRGGRDFEIRDRRNREAIRTAEEVGYGTVYVAFSKDPFRYGEFSRGDHWDYRSFDDYEITDDADAVLTQIAQRMAVGSSFIYETDSYYLNPPAAYTRAYRSYRSNYYGRHDHNYGLGIRIGFGFGGPRYYGWPLHPYGRYSYLGVGYGYDPYYYDPFYYDPFYYDPFYFGFGYRGFSGGSYYGPSYAYWPRYYSGSSVVRVNYNYTTRNRPVIASTYRDRRLAPSRVAAGAQRRTTVARAQPRRASTVIARRTRTGATGNAAVRRRSTPTRATGSATVARGDRRTTGSSVDTRRRTASRAVTGTTPSQGERRTTRQRRPTTGGNVRRTTPKRSSAGAAEPVRRYRVAPRPSARVTQSGRVQAPSRPAPQRRAAPPSSRSTTSQARPQTSSSGRRATPARSSTSRSLTQARPQSSGGRRATPQRSTATRSATRRSAPQRSVTQRRAPSRSSVSRPPPSRSSGRSAARSSGSSSRSGSSVRRSSGGSRGSAPPVRTTSRRRRS